MANDSSPAIFPIPDLCYSSTFWTVAQVIVSLTFTLIIMSNVLLLLVTWRAAKSRINPYLFGSLAMSDLLMGILVLPFHLDFAVSSEAQRPGDVGCSFSGVMFHIFQTISLFSFFTLSLDRLLSIEIPLRYPTLITWKVNVMTVVLIWSVPSLMYGVLPATGLGIYEYKCWQCMCNLGYVNLDYLTFLMLFCVVIFLATYLLNARIFYIARQQSLKLQALEQQFQLQTGHRLHMADKMKAARSILLALSLFTLCWGPYYSVLFCFVLFQATTTPLTEFSLLWLAISNSYMNFFVFVATYRSFRSHFLKMFGFSNRVDAIDITILSSTN